jgi:hypothetical protein
VLTVGEGKGKLPKSAELDPEFRTLAVPGSPSCLGGGWRK